MASEAAHLQAAYDVGHTHPRPALEEREAGGSRLLLTALLSLSSALAVYRKWLQPGVQGRFGES